MKNLREVFNWKLESMKDDLLSQIKNLVIDKEVDLTKKPWNETLSFKYDGRVLNIHTNNHNSACRIEYNLTQEGFLHGTVNLIENSVCVDITKFLIIGLNNKKEKDDKR